MPSASQTAGDRKTIRVSITGRVQGVWYRAWTIEQATLRGLSGWVRNRHDGSVEALFSGSTAMVDDMVAACRNGPKMARVAAVETFDAEAPTHSGFIELPTA
jgi:acylphosphatase